MSSLRTRQSSVPATPEPGTAIRLLHQIRQPTELPFSHCIRQIAAPQTLQQPAHCHACDGSRTGGGETARSWLQKHSIAGLRCFMCDALMQRWTTPQRWWSRTR